MENEGAPQALPSEKVEPFVPENKPDMQTLDFLMWLPKGRSGFTFKTDQSLTRGPMNLTEEEKALIKKKMPGQIAFNHGNLAKEALDKYRANPTEETKNAYEAARLEYLERASPEVGIRNVRISGNTITADTRPIEFPINGALDTLNANQHQLEISTLSATSGNVIFAPDKTGKRRLGLMLRSKRNGNWRDVPGTLIAGYFDGKLNKKPSKLSPTQGRRTLEPINNDSIFGNATKELHEETGLEPTDVKSRYLAGLAVEKKNRAHHEFLVDVELKMTAEQAREKSKKHSIDIKEEFPEEWVDIEYTPEAIYKLLTQVQCPLPDSHYASYAATGRRLMAELKGDKAAEEYMRALEIGIAENKERINATVRKYLRENPDVMNSPTKDQLDKVEEKMAEFAEKNPNATDEEKAKQRETIIAGLPKFNSDGFNPALLPQEQGLQDVKTALMQVGLIEDHKIVQFPQPQAQTTELAKAA